jgi:competence protein ComEA
VPDLVPPPDAPIPRPPVDVSPLRSLSGRLEAWRSDPRAGAVVLAVLAVAAGFFWFRSGTQPTGAAAETSSPGGPASTAAAPGGASTTVPPSELVVHVAGAVVEPGVVRLAPGARVVDALDSAGGPAAGADLDRLNLAAPLTDGQRVAVPRVGEPTPPLAEGSAVPSDAHGAAAGAPIDLNTATAADLETLPGIGPMLAAAIVAERERNGPFKSIDDLQRVRGIGEGRIAPLRELVRV